MINGKSVLAIIPARGGSKGLPGKNIKELCGKPLIAWSIEQAKSCSDIDKTVVSTDDEKIAEVAKKYGAEVPFMRPAELANDTTSTIDVIFHAINWLKEHENYQAGYILLLNHWHLYYAELAKFKSCFEKKHGRTTKLEQWVYFIGNIQDSSASLNSFVEDNKGIKEVHDMLQTVTQNAKFREQYRLHEELLRVQRGEESRRQQLQKALTQEMAAKEVAFKGGEDREGCQGTKEGCQGSSFTKS